MNLSIRTVVKYLFSVLVWKKDTTPSRRRIGS